MAVVEFQGVTKDYPGVRALDAVSFGMEPGEVHGVIGENGAGKSTLMKILSGIERASGGDVVLKGEVMRTRHVKEAMDKGIVMIHQELNLVDDLTVAENIFLGREKRKFWFWVDHKRMEAESREYLAKVGCEVDPRRKVEGLSVAQKQLVEIAKALTYGAEVLVMDEPTAVLTEREIDAFFKLVAELKSEGVTVVLISHILEELTEHCDRISVLRDGKFVGTVGAHEVSPKELAHMMVGRELGELYPDKSWAGIESERLRVEGLDVPGFAEGVEFSVAAGEILGLAGLVGAGRTEVCEAVAGIREKTAGNVYVGGKLVVIKSPMDGLKQGIAYLSEDRKALGLHQNLAIRSNIVLPNIREYSKWVMLDKKAKENTEDWKGKLGIKAPDLGAGVNSLSGGNQQKVALAKWLETGPEILILDEPTRGIDIGSKAEIYQLIKDLAAAGKAVVMVSSEMQELLGVCHRIVVMRSGKVVGEVMDGDMTEQKVMELAAGVQNEVSA